MLKGHKHTEETKRKIRIAHIGMKFSEDAKNNMKKAKLENPTSPTSTLYWLGKKRSQETISKMKKAWKTRKPFSIESRRKMGDSHRGAKTHLWRGGITRSNIKIRNSMEFKLWRTAVFERDKYTCIWCGARNGNGKAVILNADHIKPFSLYPELRFAIDNGRTLCRDCHRKTDTYGNKIYHLIHKNN